MYVVLILVGALDGGCVCVWGGGGGGGAVSTGSILRNDNVPCRYF